MSGKDIAGTLGLFAGIALFSTIEITSKIIGSRVDPFQMAFIRFFFSGLALLILCGRSLPRILSGLSRKDHLLFLLNGFFGVTLSLTLFHAAILVFEKAASCAVVFSANPLFVLVLARFINQEPWSPTKWLAVILGAAGISCFAWESGAFAAGSLLAIGMMLTSAFFFGVHTCISRRVIARYGAVVLAGFSSLYGSLLTLPFVASSFVRQGAGPILDAWLPLAYITFACTALAYVLYYYGLSRTSAFRGSSMFFLKPVLATVLAALILHETINAYMIAGTILILLGLFTTLLAGRIRARIIRN